MHKVSEVIVVEGRYDKNTLSQVVDAVIIETSGFGVFNNKEKQQLLRTLAENFGHVGMLYKARIILVETVINGNSSGIHLAHLPADDGKDRR